MPTRALTAVAVLTAALAGTAAGQGPPSPGSVGPGGSPFYPNLAGAADGPAVMPAQFSGPAMPPGPPPRYATPIDSVSAGPSGPANGPNAWVGVEYLFFWVKKGPLPIPVAIGAQVGSNGVIGSPNSTVLLGGSEFDYKQNSGVRVSAGCWFTDNQTFGVEGSFFILPQKTAGQGPVFATDQYPVLARPFFDTALNRPNSRVLTSPNLFTGGIKVDSTSQLWGAELAAVCRVAERGSITLDGIFGFKFLNLEESLQVNDFSNSVGGNITFAGRTFARPATTYVEDRFGTFNRFYGGVVGLRAGWHVEAFTLSLTGKLGVGSVQQNVRVDGSTTLTGAFFPTPVVAGGGFFATANSVGRYSQNEFGLIPEGAANLNVQVTPRLSVNLGYSYLVMNRVLRPGEQPNLNLSNAQITTGPNFGTFVAARNPVVTFDQSTFWAQGVNVGLNYGF